MSLFSKSKRVAMAGLMSALVFGSAGWLTPAEARGGGGGGHFGGAGHFGGTFGGAHLGGFGSRSFGGGTHLGGSGAGRFGAARARGFVGHSYTAPSLAYGYPQYSYDVDPYFADWDDAGLAGAYPLALGAVAATTTPSAPASSLATSADRNWLSACEDRYQSFDPASGTFLGYDGRRHVCRF